MLSTSLLTRFDGRRLTVLLALLFAALAIPTGVVIWQAYGQLEREAYYRYRGTAEELTRRIDDGLRKEIVAAERRSFADYNFLMLAGNPIAKFVQRSPLAAYPVDTGPPGIIGYFQVDPEGDFSTPLLPPDGTEPASVGIDAAEYAKRVALAGRLREILTDNRLVRHRLPEREFRRDGEASNEDAGRDRTAAAIEEAGADRTDVDDKSARTSELARYSQKVFDELGKSVPKPQNAAAGTETLTGGLRSGSLQNERRAKVADLELEPAFSGAAARPEEEALPPAPQSAYRGKRKEQTALPAAETAGVGMALGKRAERDALRISTFESELDPFEFSLLDSGHFVLFRKVWRGGQRFIQGLLIDPDAFLESTIAGPFETAALAGRSDLVIAYYDEVLRGAGSPEHGDSGGLGAREGRLLYRGRLSAPLDSLGLIFSVGSLPLGPGARVLGWASVLLAVVFVAGFYSLQRLARGQLRLARQQQDFVSAVSHELKTPLTSIRMYGEMLKEGWAGEDKRRQYYEYIHDESERLTRLISNVLQLASITRNETNLVARSVSVRELMDSIEAKASSQVERSGFDMAFDRDERAEAASVLIDRDCFLQIVINLIDNAVKFSAGASDKRIEIGSRLVGNEAVVFTVRDFGPGVPRDQMKKIFELFYRSGNELTRETVGTGIGLAIVHQLTVAMKGSVDVVNRDPGAEFRVSFPFEH